MSFIWGLVVQTFRIVLPEAKHFWTQFFGPKIILVPEPGPKMWSTMLYLCFLLSDWDKIWVVKVFLNCIATSNFEPML